MQLCPIKSCGFFGSGRFSKIRRRTDDGHAHVRPDPHRDHVLGDLLAAAHTGVVAFRDDIGQAVVDIDLDLDSPGIRAEASQVSVKEWRLRRILGARDPDGAGGLVAKVTHGGKLGVDLLEARTNVLKQAFARLRGCDAARGAGQQPNAEARFKFANGVAERRLRHAELRCGFRETAFPPTARNARRSSRLPRCIYGSAHKSMRIIAPSRRAARANLVRQSSRVVGRQPNVVQRWRPNECFGRSSCSRADACSASPAAWDWCAASRARSRTDTGRTADATEGGQQWI